MIDVIIFAIIAFLLIKKLISMLGDEHDQKVFGYDSTIFEQRAMKDAEPVDNMGRKDLFENFGYLSESAKDSVKKIALKINGFTLEKFQDIAIKVLEKTIKASNEKNENELKKLLSCELLEIFKQSFKSDDINQIILVEIENTKIEDVTQTKDVFEISISFKMKQINYTTDNKGNIIDGSKSNFVDVNERWFFTHDFTLKDATWFVNKIESLEY